MAEQLTRNEKERPIADNARKFIVTDFDESLLAEEGVATYLLTTNWLKTGEDDEAKLAHKDFYNGKVEMLFIEKVTENGKRNAFKHEIGEDGYNGLLANSTVEVIKERFEFNVIQDGVELTMKYDKFVGPKNLRMLEVDAINEEERKNFTPTVFFAGYFEEVTGDRGYEGYRVADKV